MPKGKILSITFVNDWTAQDGTVYYYHALVIDNGDVGSAALKTINQYQIGQNVEYEIEGDRIKKVKLVGTKPPAKSSTTSSYSGRKSYSKSARNPVDFLGFIYGYAKDIHIAEMNITGKVVPIEKLKSNVEEMYAHISELLDNE
jgi:hypothetical protein